MYRQAKAIYKSRHTNFTLVYPTTIRLYLCTMKKGKNNFQLSLTSVLLLVASAYIVGLFVDIQGDAAKYAAIARYMVEGSDWLAIKERFGEPYLQKPPFLFWLVATSFSCFGFSNLSFKLFPFLFCLLAGYFTFRFAKEFYTKTIAYFSAIVFFTLESTFFYSNDVRTDTILMPLVIFAVWQSLLFCKKKQTIYAISTAIAIGLAMLTKGPLGFALPFIALATDILLRRNWKCILAWQWILVFFIPLAMLTPYLNGLYGQFGYEGIHFFFWKNNAGRITGSYLKNYSDPFFYLHTILWLFFPWSFFLFIGFVRQCYLLYKQKFLIDLSSYQEARFTYLKEGASIGIIGIFILIISIASFKSPNYLYVLTPFASLIVGITISDIYQRKRFFGWNISRVLFVRIMIIATASIALVNIVLSIWVYPYVFKYHKYRQASNIISKETLMNKSLYVYKDKQALVSPTLKFYLDKPAIPIENIDTLSQLDAYWLLIKTEDFQQIDDLNVKASIKKMHELTYFKTKNSLPLQLFLVKKESKKLEKYLLIEF